MEHGGSPKGNWGAVTEKRDQMLGRQKRYSFLHLSARVPAPACEEMAQSVACTPSPALEAHILAGPGGRASS